MGFAGRRACAEGCGPAFRTASMLERGTPPPRGILPRVGEKVDAAGLSAAFVFALLEAVAAAVHLQDMHMVGEPIQQSAGQPFRPPALRFTPEKACCWSPASSHARNVG